MHQDTNHRPRRRARAAAALALGLGVGLAGAGTAAAQGGPPERFSERTTFVDLNPCTGELDEYSVDLDILFVGVGEGGAIRIKRSGTTASGYEMQGSSEIGRRNDNFERWDLHDIWHGADGSVIEARGAFGVDLRAGEVVRDDFVLRCLGR
jgi:hypothetical protein